MDFGLKVAVDARFGCWIWLGALNGKGYGPHRATWERYFGVRVPAGVQLDHACRRRRCQNPLHLDPVTAGDNQRRRSTRGRRGLERCPLGHRLTHETTSTTPEGGVVCHPCNTESTKWLES